MSRSIEEISAKAAEFAAKGSSINVIAAALGETWTIVDQAPWTSPGPETGRKRSHRESERVRDIRGLRQDTGGAALASRLRSGEG